jgi:DNA-binding winged helix-turn-helix (wHTH) protein
VAISLNSKFIIGRYIYCTQERFLYLEGEPINIEPKMADVLDYLLLNTERYVPLQELHDEVWAGRIVTDTAVRRVVSRLRSLIEVDPSKPEIIKSLPKRGYRLFSMPASAELANKHLETSAKSDIDLVDPSVTSSAEQASTLETDASQTADGEVQTEALQHEKITEGGIAISITGVADEVVNHQDNKAQQHILTRSASRYGLWIFILVLLLVTCVGVLYFINQPNNLEPHVEKLEDGSQTTELVLSHFDSLPQNSRLLAISKNGELAFYEQVREDGSAELYLHEINQGKQWKIASPELYSGYAAFVENDSAILLSFNSGSATEGSLQLWHLDEDKQVSRKRLLISDIQGTTSVILGEKPNSAFVSITTLVDDKAKSEFQFISWDKDALIVQEQITSAYNGQSMDIYGSLSIDYKYLAYVRKPWLDHEQEIQILELATGKIIKRIPWRQEARALAWQEKKTLLVLNKQNLTSINIDTDNKTELFVNLYGRFWQMYLLDRNIYLYKREVLTRYYIELGFVDGVTRSMKRERAATSVSVNISKYNSKEWYEVIKEGEKYHFSLINLDNSEQYKRLFSSDEYFEILDQSLNGEFILKVGDRVGLLKPSGEIEFINSEQKIVEDAVFDRDGVNIIYSQIKNNEWSIHLLDVKSKQSTFIRQGYKSTRVSEELYLFWRVDGELFKSETLTGELIPLSVKGNLFFSPIWGMAYPNIYWMDFISSKLVLRKLNLESHKQEIVETDFYFGFEFNISKNGEQLIIDGLQDADSQIYVIDSVVK